MANKQSPHFHDPLSEIPNKIFGVTNVNFPGDENGNHLSAIEAAIKIKADELTQGTINDLIVTTKDKLKIQLNDYQKILSGKTDMIGSIGIAIALLLALVASDFKDALSIKAAIWEAIFIILFIVSIIYLIYLIWKIISNKNKRDINYLIQKIKKGDDL